MRDGFLAKEVGHRPAPTSGDGRSYALGGALIVRAITAPNPPPIMPCPGAPEQRLGALNDACNSRTFQIVGTRLRPQQRGPCGMDSQAGGGPIVRKSTNL